MPRKWIRREFRTDQSRDRSDDWWQGHMERSNSGQWRERLPQLSLEQKIERFRFSKVCEQGDLTVSFDDLNGISQLIGLEGESGVEFVLSAANACFREFTQPKKGGGVRNLAEPLGDRRRFLDRLKPTIENYPALQRYIPFNAFGFRPGLGILDNLLYHLPPIEKWCPDLQIEVWNADLKEAFPNTPIRKRQVRRIDDPNSLAIYGTCVEEIFRKFRLSTLAAELLLHLVTWKDVIPQGSPVSPTLMVMTSSGLLKDIDVICRDFSREFGHLFKSSIYADDLTISTVGHKIPSRLINKVVRVARGYWPINYGKICHYRLGDIPHITGLTFVKGKVQVRRAVKEGHRLRISNLIRDLRTGRAMVDQADPIVSGIIAFHIGIYGNYQNIPRRLKVVMEEYAQVRFLALLTPR